MNIARENILRRVRQAVRQPAPLPAGVGAGEIWPSVGDLEQRFRQEFVELKGEIIEDLPAFLAGFTNIANADGTGVPVREAELGVTPCDCLVAQTGSVVLTARSAGGRALSVLPPVHLVLARREQLVPDLDAALVLLRQRYGERWPSLMTVISGPSRTADIEKVLVMGAHGPKRLALHFVA